MIETLRLHDVVPEQAPDYDEIGRVYHSMLLRCLEWRRRKGDDHTRSYADALAKTASKSVKAIVRKRRILFAGIVAPVREERPPQMLMFWRGCWRKGLLSSEREGLDCELKGGYVGLWNKVQRVAKQCAKGGQIVSTGRGGSRVIHAKMA